MAKRKGHHKKGHKKSRRKMRGTGDDVLREVLEILGIASGVLSTRVGLNMVRSLSFITPTGSQFVGGAPVLVSGGIQHFVPEKYIFFKRFFQGSAGYGVVDLAISNVSALNGISNIDISGFENKVNKRVRAIMAAKGLTISKIRVAGHDGGDNQAVREFGRSAIENYS